MFNKKIFIMILVIITSQLFAGEIFSITDSQVIEKILNENNINRIALVGALKMPENISLYGLEYLTDEINNKLTRMNNYKFEIIIRDKNELKQMLTELKLQSDNVIDPDSAKNIGKLLGVESIIYLNLYTDKINIRFINVETGRILWSEMKPLTDEYKDLLYPGHSLPTYFERLFKPHPTRELVEYKHLKKIMLAISLVFILITTGIVSKGKRSEKSIGYLFCLVGIATGLIGYFI